MTPTLNEFLLNPNTQTAYNEIGIMIMWNVTESINSNNESLNRSLVLPNPKPNMKYKIKSRNQINWAGRDAKNTAPINDLILNKIPKDSNNAAKLQNQKIV